MSGKEAKTNGMSIRGGTGHADDSFRCTRRYFIKGVGATGSAGSMGSVSNVATASRAGPNDISTRRLSQVWSTGLSSTVQAYLIDEDLLYVGSEGGTVRTLSVETGREVNRIDLGETLPPYGIAKDGKRIAVGLATGRLKIINTNAFSVQQTIPFNGEFRGIAATNGSAYLATHSGVERIALSDGTTHWRYDGRGPSGPIWATSEGLAVYRGGKIVLLAEDDGEPIWGTPGPNGQRKIGNWLEHDVFWALTELESYFIRAAIGGGYSLLNKFTGEQLWAATGGGHVNRAIATSDRVIHQQGTSIVSRNLETGEEFWKTDVVAPHAKSMILYDGSIVVFGTRKSDDADVLMSLNPSSRGIEWETEVDGPIGLVSKDDARLFGVNLERDEIRAYLPASELPEDGTSATTESQTPTKMGSGSQSGSQKDDRNGRPERGFFTNGDGSAFAGLSGGNTITIASIFVTGVSMVLSLLQMIRGK